MPTFKKTVEFWFGPPKSSDVEEPIHWASTCHYKSLFQFFKICQGEHRSTGYPHQTICSDSVQGSHGFSEGEEAKNNSRCRSVQQLSTYSSQRCSCPNAERQCPRTSLGNSGASCEDDRSARVKPSYAGPDGRVVLFSDSIKAELGLSISLLRGLALPRDVDQVPSELIPGLTEMCSHLVQVFLFPWLFPFPLSFWRVLTFVLLGQAGCFEGI